MTSVRRVLSPVSPRRWPDLLGKVLPNYRRTALLLRLRYHAWRFHASVTADIHPSVRIGKRINIDVFPRTQSRLSIGAGSTLGHDSILRLRGGSIEIGEGVMLRASCALNVGRGGVMRLDGPHEISWGVTIHCANSVHLSERVYIGEYATIVDSSHYYSAPDEWSYYNSRSAPIDIGVDTWICPKATITSGVTIGDHSIVASNSVVVKDAPSGVLLSGVPATVVRKLEHPWLSHDRPEAELA